MLIMIILKEIEIKKCLSLSYEFLHFENNNYATIFNCAPSSNIRGQLITAIQPFFYKSMMSLPMDGEAEAEPGESFVRIKFLLFKEQTDEHIIVDAMRLCNKPEELYYYYDKEQYIESMEKFHERCHFDVVLFYPFLDDVFTNNHKNLMYPWFAIPCPLRVASENAFEIFAEYLSMGITCSGPEHKEIIELAEQNIAIEMEAEIVKKRTFVQIANEIGEIFHRLTFKKYNVRFNIPLSEDNIDIMGLSWIDLDLINVVTKVNKNGESESYIWNQAHLGLQFLLKVAQIISYAKHLGIGFVFISDATDLQEYQNTQMVKEAIEQTSGQDAEADWQTKNFIKHITNVCNEMKVMIVMNYHGILALPPEDTNIVKSRISLDDNTMSLYVCNDMQPLSLVEFTEKFTLPAFE